MSKEFISNAFLPKVVQETTFQMMWPQLHPKAYIPSFHRYLEELEEKFLRQAKEKSLFIEKEAYEKGFAQGEKDGLELGQERIEAMLHQLENLLLEIVRQREDLYKAYEREMLQLVLCLAKKVVHHELMLREDIIQASLQEAFQYVVDRRKVIIHLNPIDYQYFLNHPGGFPSTLDHMKEVKVTEDPKITRGGCFLETSFGEIDATVESLFEEIASLIWEQWEQSKGRSDRPTS